MTEKSWQEIPVGRMEGIHLFHSGLSTCSQSIRMALHEKGCSWTSHSLDMRSNEHLAAEYMAINPNAVVPTLVHDGQIVLETLNILAYLEKIAPSPRLFSIETREAAAISLWSDRWVIFKSQSKIMSFEFLFRDAGKRSPEHLAQYVENHPNPDYVAFQQAFHADSGFPREQVTNAVSIAQKGFADLDLCLADHAYIVGDTMSAADLIWLPKIHRLQWMHFPIHLFPSLERWYQKMIARESAQAGIVAHEPVHIRKFLSDYGHQRKDEGTDVTAYLMAEPALA